MSTVDPELRWWRNARTLWIIAASLWVVVFAVAAVTGWSNALYSAGSQWATWAGADWLVGVEGVAEPVVRISQVSLVVVAWPVVVAGFVEGYARHRGGGGEGWPLARAFGWTLLGLGVGALVAVILGPVGWLVPTLLILAAPPAC
ncbi:hypothetical protein [Microbacterium indicum]|uniref:hypothetical protein n=1 Tax=Microbacterium indicum TaxID=358100 RepID=UPI00040389F4|nr:hypothetical protein [Microbacterium indicum]